MNNANNNITQDIDFNEHEFYKQNFLNVEKEFIDEDFKNTKTELWSSFDKSFDTEESIDKYIEELANKYASLEIEFKENFDVLKGEIASDSIKMIMTSNNYSFITFLNKKLQVNKLTGEYKHDEIEKYFFAKLYLNKMACQNKDYISNLLVTQMLILTCSINKYFTEFKNSWNKNN
jgi:hypothetical protein